MQNLLMRILASLSIFVGSILLFLIQPMIGNLMLPHFGGTSTVWIVCLCTFQVLLIVGYAYAHFLHGRLRTSLHVALLLIAAAVMLPCVWMAESFVPTMRGVSPIFAVVLFLLITVALPYVLVGANASLVQSLVAKDRGGFRLYAISNAGSFVGLISYPLMIEPMLSLGHQIAFYAVGVAAYAVLLSILLVTVGRLQNAHKAEPAGSLLAGLHESGAARWFCLSASSCFLLDSVTTHLTTIASPLPLLWCVILALYLASWILAFTDIGSRVGLWAAPVLFLLDLVAVWHLGAIRAVDYLPELGIGLALLFLGTWYIHSRLYALRPGVRFLTSYYFIIAVGGAVGGVVATLVAPVVFPFVAEYPIALVGLLVLLALYAEDALPKIGWNLEFWHFAPVILIAGYFAFSNSQKVTGKLLFQSRNFYGTNRVAQYDAAESAGAFQCNYLYNNGTMHGFQLVQGGNLALHPSSYYTKNGGGLCVLEHPMKKAGKSICAAFLGMGIGTMAVYGEEGDEFCFFEINPEVNAIAHNKDYFSFVPTSRAKIRTVLGDARKELEKDPTKYDLIVVDVFTGDSIPPHMATKEAVELYLSRLSEGGVLAFHISNWHLDLRPMVKSIAKSFGLECMGVTTRPVGVGYAAEWVYLSRKPMPFEIDPKIQTKIDFSDVEDVPLMTDGFHPLVRYINFKGLFGAENIKSAFAWSSQ